MQQFAFKRLIYKVSVLLFSMQLGLQVQAQTIVDVSTSRGDFSIELFDSQTPGTVQNFLNYINSGRYTNSIVHRSVSSFVIQGGGFNWPVAASTLGRVLTDGPISNEPGISNTRGTVAMAKLDGNPNSATSQWFINLVDNSSLDTQNGGFTVFGQVVGDGMAVVDDISRQPVVNLLTAFGTLQSFPLLDFVGGNVARENMVFTEFSIRAEDIAPNRFDNESSMLILRVDAGSDGIVELSFSIESQSPDVVIRGLVETVMTLPTIESGYSTFDAGTGQLTIPELEIDGNVAYRNLVLTLTDADQLLFTLQSFE